jgi:hypothetical protein
MVFNPQSFWKFFTIPTQLIPSTSSLSYYWDIQAYAELALQPQCSAFYPLWPTLIHWGFQPTSITEAARDFLWVATGLSVVTVPLSLILFRKAFQDDRLALGITLLYHLSPLAIFRVIGYTESLFSVLAILLLLLLQSLSRPSSRSSPLSDGLAILNITGVGLLAAILGLMRPTLPQMIGASLATLITLGGIQGLTPNDRSVEDPDETKDPEEPKAVEDTAPWQTLWAKLRSFQQQYPYVLPVSLALILGTIVGYSVYGGFCWQTTGDFFGPFSQQSLWNKRVGIRPWLLFTSRSPLVDLWGLYLPPLLWLIALGQVGQAVGVMSLVPLRGGLGSWLLALYPPLWLFVQSWQRSLGLSWRSPQPSLPVPPWAAHYDLWFAVYFALAHGAIVWLTQDRLVSLGRYIFGQPFIFLALGYLYPHLGRQHQRFLWPMLLGLSMLYLLQQWVRYGNHQWLG